MVPIFEKNVFKKKQLSLGPHSAAQRYYISFSQPVCHLTAVNQLFLKHLGYFSVIFTPILVKVLAEVTETFVLVCHGSLHFR